MQTPTEITCDVNSDLMLLYSSGKASPQTNALVENHMESCEACRQAFSREPAYRRRMGEQPDGDADEIDRTLEQLKNRLLPAWSFTLFLFSRGLALTDSLLKRLGVSTATLKIRLYRARRRVAEKMV